MPGGRYLLLTEVFARLFELPRPAKRGIQIAFDLAAMVASFWVAMVLRLDGIKTSLQPESWAVLLLVAPVTIFVFVRLGLYRAVIRFLAERALRAVFIGVAVSAVTMLAASQALGLFVPRSVPGIYFAVLLVTVGGSRVLMRSLYLSARARDREPVLIYGAGETGRQILLALDQSRNYRAGLFVDDNTQMHGAQIGGVDVVSLEAARAHAARIGIKTALLALPQSSLARRRAAALALSDLGLEVRTVPNVSDLVTGRVRVSELRRLRVEDLLGRDPVPPIPELLSRTTAGRSVMVTGAGGSIGSELCRQVLSQGPRRLVLFEASELALYTIDAELRRLIEERATPCEVVPVLGSVCSAARVTRALRDHRVETLFHAAAYKHVPLVEANVVEGVLNNALGTEVVAEAAGRLGVGHFTLVSTDKAVRPTNVMGATKRLAELVVQAKAQLHPGTRYCAVRFGNVLGSSGSVIPLFEAQLDAGGPITLTHPDVKRYFMTIPEAAQLVIQASSMAERGEVFLLDMGEPVIILDLARRIARLRGREAYLEGVEDERPGGVAIRVTGLRPGEKFFEELLTTGEPIPTRHPSIAREALEPPVPTEVGEWVTALQDICAAADEARLLSALEDLPLEYSGAKPAILGNLTA